MTRSSFVGQVSGLPISKPALALTIVLLLTGVITVDAQSNKKATDASVRTLQGTVLASDGNLVEQAVVQLKDSRTLQVYSFITKANGSYHFGYLKADVEYEVKASHAGLTSDWKRVSIFDTRPVVVLNLKLDKKETK
jgi:Carboxypeptidase regulatory-like domain